MKGYRLGTIQFENSNQKLNLKGEISEKEFLKINEHSENLFRFKSQQELHSMFIINFLEFNDLFKLTIQKFLRKNSELLKEDSKDLKFISRNSNRLFLIFLSSGRTFLDHSETYLKRKYGNESLEFLKFKKETNNQFDNSFEYRFMYKLRNYAQHCGLPINNIIYSIKNNIQENEYERKINLNPVFDIEKLLNNYKDWGKVLKKDFEGKPSQISVTSVLKEYYKNIESLNESISIIETKSLQNSINYLEKFAEKYNQFEKDEHTELCIFYNFELPDPNSYENSTFETYKLPKDLIAEIKEKTTANTV